MNAHKVLIPGWTFITTGFMIFAGSIYGILEIDRNPSYRHYLLGLHIAALVLAPALAVYPIIRFFFGARNVILNSIFSLLIGWIVNSKVDKIWKKSQEK